MMINHKRKLCKRKNPNVNITLEQHHENTIKEFQKQIDSAKQKNASIKHLEEKLKTLQSNQDQSASKIDQILSLEKKIHRLKVQNDLDKIQKEFNDYMNKTSHIIFEYQKQLNNGEEDQEEEYVPEQSKKNNILDFFYRSKEEKQETGETQPTTQEEPNETQQTQQTRQQLLTQYLKQNHKNYENTNNETEKIAHCYYCDSDNVQVIQHDSVIVCNNCSSIQQIVVESEKPSYHEPPKEISHYSYKRINHFTEQLNQVQAKESTYIPADLIEQIIQELKKEKITDFTNIKKEKIKQILKKLKVNKYYEHIPYIIYRINGIPKKTLPPDLEERIKMRFLQIQEPFLKTCPKNRKNFLSYSYVIHKFLQLEGAYEFLPYFPLLKSRDKLYAIDEQWKLICNACNYTYIKSI